MGFEALTEAQVGSLSRSRKADEMANWLRLRVLTDGGVQYQDLRIELKDEPDTPSLDSLVQFKRGDNEPDVHGKIARALINLNYADGDSADYELAV